METNLTEQPPNELTEPPIGEWIKAHDDYDRGRVMQLDFAAPDDQVRIPVSMTLSWLGAWRTLPLTKTQRRAIRTATIQISRGQVHPCLNQQRAPQKPHGAQQVSPTPDVLVTWRPHWSALGVPVLLTCTLRGHAPRV